MVDGLPRVSRSFLEMFCVVSNIDEMLSLFKSSTSVACVFGITNVCPSAIGFISRNDIVFSSS